MNIVNAYSIPGLKTAPPQKKPFERSPHLIIMAVCDHVNKPVGDVLGDSRSQEFVVPRYAIIYLLYHYTSLNKSQIGREVYRDHTTVINALKVFQDRIDTEDYIKDLVNKLKEIIL
jgi:chromosomal replication initiation ATPase DnaA